LIATANSSRIAEALQSGTRTLLTEIDIPNLDGALAVAISRMTVTRSILLLSEQ
jgi:hypothetical protein